MGAPTTVQEARKAQQTERLERKAGIKTPKDAKKYAEWYAAQPQEVERAKLHAAHQVHVDDLANTAEAMAVAEITGDGYEEAKHAHAVAELVVARSVVPKRSAGNRPGLSASTAGST